jgi:hypothetical protein
VNSLRLYTLAEVAEVTGLSRRSLEDGARAVPPKFVHVRDGGRRYMTESQIEQMIKDRTVGMGSAKDDDDVRRAGIRKRLEQTVARKRLN